MPFAGIELPVLGCADAVLFKATFDRSRDWVDIEAVAAGTLDVPPQGKSWRPCSVSMTTGPDGSTS